MDHQKGPRSQKGLSVLSGRVGLTTTIVVSLPSGVETVEGSERHQTKTSDCELHRVLKEDLTCKL